MQRIWCNRSKSKVNSNSDISKQGTLFSVLIFKEQFLPIRFPSNKHITFFFFKQLKYCFNPSQHVSHPTAGANLNIAAAQSSTSACYHYLISLLLRLRTKVFRLVLGLLNGRSVLNSTRYLAPTRLSR